MTRTPPTHLNGYDSSDRGIKVVLACNAEWVSERQVQVTIVSHDPQGRDWLAFICPRCGREHESFRYA